MSRGAADALMAIFGFRRVTGGEIHQPDGSVLVEYAGPVREAACACGATCVGSDAVVRAFLEQHETCGKGR